jgi:muramoyltetrapeptide carboxypeptidase
LPNYPGTVNSRSLVKPAGLRTGDRIGIIAPASPVDPEKLERGCASLRDLGYDPVFEPSIFENDLLWAGSVQRRARELESMFLRDDVQAILCARGGYGCSYLLPEIDLDLIRRHPKIIAGYSDATCLLTWFHDALGMTTFHAPMAAVDFAANGGVDIASFQNAVQGRNPEYCVAVPGAITDGEGEGKLYGGCLSLTTASLGTPYAIQTGSSILFIEDVAAKPYQIDRMLMQLRLAGKLDGIRGILFGPMLDCDPPASSNYSLIDVLRRNLGDLGVPVGFGVNSGHVTGGNITLPLGVQARLTVEEDKATLILLESGVAI